MKQKHVIPFPQGWSALQLSRDAIRGAVCFDWKLVETICAASGIDPQLFRSQHEDNVALIVAWYAQHRQGGGSSDPAAEQLIAEPQAEDQFGDSRIQRGPINHNEPGFFDLEK